MSTARSRAEITIEARDKASRELGQINNETQALTGNVERMGKAMMVAGAAITAVLTKAVMDFVRVGDEMHKMGIRTGLTADQLGALGHMAQRAGGDLGTVERTLRRMQGGLFRAGTLSAEVKDELNALGVTIEELQRLSPEDQFHRLMEALAGVENHSQRAAAAQALFGRSGTALLPMIHKGTAAYKKAREEGEKYSYVTEEMTKSSAAFRDAQLDLRMSLMGVSAALVQDLVPHITRAMKFVEGLVIGMRDWLRENEKVARIIGVSTAAIGLFALTVGTATIATVKILPHVKALKSAFIAKSAVMLGYSAKLLLAVASLEALNRAMSMGLGRAAESTRRFAEQTESLRELGGISPARGELAASRLRNSSGDGYRMEMISS